MGEPGRVKRIAGIALLIVLSPVILVYILVQIPFSGIDKRRRVRRQKSFEAKMKAAGRFVPWAELRSRLNTNSEGTLIAEIGGDLIWNLWWTREDIPALSPYPCCFEEPGGETNSEAQVFRPFFEWCQSRFTSPESGTAMLVGIENVKSYLEGDVDRAKVFTRRGSSARPFTRLKPPPHL